MKTKLALGAVVAALAVFSQTAFAQTAPVTRDQRKADTAAANKSGALAAPGQGPGAMASQPNTGSEKSRMERKAQTEADAKAGKLAPAGDSATAKDVKADATKSSDKTRAERKAQTQADISAGKVQPAGDSPNPGSAAPKK